MLTSIAEISSLVIVFEAKFTMLRFVVGLDEISTGKVEGHPRERRKRMTPSGVNWSLWIKANFANRGRSHIEPLLLPDVEELPVLDVPSASRTTSLIFEHVSRVSFSRIGILRRHAMNVSSETDTLRMVRVTRGGEQLRR